MASHRQEKERKEHRARALHAAAKLFLEKGYTQSSVREIARQAELNVNTLVRDFGTKENILCELVAYVLEDQFAEASKLVSGITEDKILLYAAETTLQLYMAESNEQLRDLYSTAYSLSNTSDIIQHTITGKLEDIFGEHLPGLDTKDFYELEIASGGIMRSFLSKPCDLYFTMDRKVARFLETTFKVYDVPKEKILEAIEFVKQFDYPAIAENTICSMLNYLESRTTSET